MIRLLLAAPAALYVSAANAAFHPVEDRSYRYDTVEIRTAGGVVRRFHTRRSIVFRRTADGYEATVTLEAFDHQAGGDVGRMFEAATGALLHRPLHYRLDAMGKVIAVEDAGVAIALIASAIERTSADRTRSPYAKALASPLRTLSPAQQQTMLASILASVIASGASERPSGVRAITLASRPPLAPGTALTGTETVSRNAAGIVTVDTQASGGIDATAPAGAPTAATAKITPVATLQAIRNVDPASGLIRDSRDVNETTMFDGTDTHRSRSETIVTLTLAAK